PSRGASWLRRAAPHLRFERFGADAVASSVVQLTPFRPPSRGQGYTRNSASRATHPRAPEIRPLLPLGRLPLALVRPARDFLHEPLQQHGPRVDVDEPALVTRPRRRPRIGSRRPGLPALARAGAWLSWFVRRHG